jgi:UDP-N-acetylglucosamine--N-acetylmuramyl-(pentapeptide) pyrophosphoryl-undecaprenol N-acetylglucosamine transferase
MILFFTSPIGLGHAIRDIAIAERLGNISSEEIVFVSGLSAHDIISNKGYQVYDVYRPKKFNVNQSMQLCSPLKWILRYIPYYLKCKKIAERFIQNNPNSLIVGDEDFASIAVGERVNRRRILITDFFETQFLQRSSLLSLIESKMNKSMQQMIMKCDHVIVPASGQNKDNVSYVGPIVRDLTTTLDRVKLRKAFGIDKQTILVSVGGTEAGKYLIHTAINAYQKLKTRLDIDMIIAPGPSLKINKNDTNANVRIIGFVSNLHEYIYASDLLISLAGRSTIDESIVYGTPGIFIPIKNHFEQEENANRIGYRYEDIFRLEALIEEKIGAVTSAPRHNMNTGQNGSQKAAQIISEAAAQ